MKTETDSVQDHMTQLKLKMVHQKIQNEKERIVNRPPSAESSNNDLENQARLQQAMLRRQELLDKIRREQMLNDDGQRPHSYSARRRYTPSPLPAPPSRRSLPDFQRYNNYYNHQNNADTYRSQKPDMSQVKHVIEHKIATPRQYHLPPLQNQQQVAIPQAPPPVIIPPPPPKIMQAPAPQYIQAPPQHIIQQVPSPVVQNLTGTTENKSMFNKADVMEMMMMQNVQMHQMVMQQLMINSLPGNRNETMTILGNLSRRLTNSVRGFYLDAQTYFGEMMMMQNAQMHQMVMQKLMLGNLGGNGGGGHAHGCSCNDCCHTPAVCCTPHGCYDYAVRPKCPLYTADRRQAYLLRIRCELGDMMMMQNAQMHQMVMQKMMLGDAGFGVGLGSSSSRRGTGCSSRHSHSHHSPRHGCGGFMPLPAAPRPSGAVHHHHYSNPAPPSQPAIHHYSTMPAMDVRGGYPRGYESAYTGPGYTYSYLDDGNNYYSYH